jgi:hypothetical protein
MNIKRDFGCKLLTNKSKDLFLTRRSGTLRRAGGYEFRKHQQSAAERNISREQFLNEHNNSDHYRPENPSSNRSRSEEAPDNVYKGP